LDVPRVLHIPREFTLRINETQKRESIVASLNGERSFTGGTFYLCDYGLWQFVEYEKLTSKMGSEGDIQCGVKTNIEENHVVEENQNANKWRRLNIFYGVGVVVGLIAGYLLSF
jgi:hypothetical protein